MAHRFLTLQAPACTGLAACALLATACGTGTKPPPPPVRLSVQSPRDLTLVRSASVEIRGTVRPANAAVMVDGHRARGGGGSFRARVALDAGVNVIDVMASAGRARPALTALRVRRRLTLEVPDVIGMDPDAAQAALAARGLRVRMIRHDGLIDRLLGGSLGVCTTDPEPGVRADAGALVLVTVARRCG